MVAVISLFYKSTCPMCTPMSGEIALHFYVTVLLLHVSVYVLVTSLPEREERRKAFRLSATANEGQGGRALGISNLVS